jgi:hypothetical protein
MDILNIIKMKNIKFLILFIVVLSCKGYEPLTEQRVNYNGNNLETDGYYYTFTNRNMGGYGNDGILVYDCFVLYRNGNYYNISHSGYNPNFNISDRLRKIEKDIEYRIENEKEYISVRPFWGVFSIQGSDLEIQRWVFSSGGGKYATQKVFGKILNDSTIHIYEQERNNPTQYGKNKKREKIDETYHFRRFSPKPDSSNIFIK